MRERKVVSSAAEAQQEKMNDCLTAVNISMLHMSFSDTPFIRQVITAVPQAIVTRSTLPPLSTQAQWHQCCSTSVRDTKIFVIALSSRSSSLLSLFASSNSYQAIICMLPFAFCYYFLRCVDGNSNLHKCTLDSPIKLPYQILLIWRALEPKQHEVDVRCDKHHLETHSDTMRK